MESGHKANALRRFARQERPPNKAEQGKVHLIRKKRQGNQTFKQGRKQEGLLKLEKVVTKG